MGSVKFRLEDLPENMRRQLAVEAPKPEKGPLEFTVWGNVMGKPRMTQRDKWKKRAVVLRWLDWKDSIKAAASKAGVSFDPKKVVAVNWIAWLPIPSSWSEKKKLENRGMPHKKKPDRDNIDKGILDALLSEDSGVSDGRLRKRWDDGQGPRIQIQIEVEK